MFLFHLLGLLSFSEGQPPGNSFLSSGSNYSRRYGIFQLKTILMIVIIWIFFFHSCAFHSSGENERNGTPMGGDLRWKKRGTS